MSYASDKNIKEVLDFILNNKGKQISIKDVPIIDGNRIKYSYILNYIQNLDDEQIIHINENTTRLMNSINKENEEKYETTIKLLDYIALEIPRTSLYNSVKSTMNSYKLTQRDIRKEVREKSVLLDKYQDKIERLQTEFISILSIFSAIVIAFFGGLNILGSSLSNIDKAKGYKLVFIILIIAFAMFNIIFMLLYVISKLTGRRISIECNNNNICKDCIENKISINRCLKGKFPIVYWYDLICVGLLIIDYIVFIMDKYNIIEYFLGIGSVNDIVGVIKLTIVLMILIGIGIWHKYKSKNNQSNKKIYLMMQKVMSHYNDCIKN